MKKKMILLLLCAGLMLALALPASAAITDEAPNYIVLVRRHTGPMVEYGMCVQFRDADEVCQWMWRTKGVIIRLAIIDRYVD